MAPKRNHFYAILREMVPFSVVFSFLGGELWYFLVFIVIFALKFCYKHIKITAISTVDQHIYDLLQEMPPITLDEMSGIRLMNRTDTKFLANKALLLEVLKLAKDDYYVQEIQQKRIARYRTTYWDSENYQFFRMHQAGRKPRTKVRVRTYEDSDGLTFLEVKKKDNHGKTKKKRIEVRSQTEVFESGGDEFVTKKVGQSLHNFHPCLQNYFKRITLVNKGKTERLTIDFDIDYTNFDTNKLDNSDQLVIIELKRDGRVFSPIKDILLKLRIKPHGYSKYVIGSYMTNPNLKANRLKIKMRSIRKINAKGAGR